MRKALKELLDAVECAIKSGDWKVDGACDPDSAIVSAKKALAQPNQEPVAYLYHDANSLEELLEAERKCLNMHSVLISIRRHEAYRNETPLYTTPPQRKE